MVWVSTRAWTCACVQVWICVYAHCVCIYACCQVNWATLRKRLITSKPGRQIGTNGLIISPRIINDAKCFQTKCFPLHFFNTDAPFPHNLTGSGTGSLVLRLEKRAHERKICHFESLHQLVKTQDGEGNKKRQRGRVQWYWAAARCEIVCECECGAGHDWKTAWSTINFYLLITNS